MIHAHHRRCHPTPLSNQTTKRKNNKKKKLRKIRKDKLFYNFECAKKIEINFRKVIGVQQQHHNREKEHHDNNSNRDYRHHHDLHATGKKTETVWKMPLSRTYSQQLFRRPRTQSGICFTGSTRHDIE